MCDLTHTWNTLESRASMLTIKYYKYSMNALFIPGVLWLFIYLYHVSNLRTDMNRDVWKTSCVSSTSIQHEPRLKTCNDP
jgi:hypothetical protein